jgi:hypothetical protein
MSEHRHDPPEEKADIVAAGHSVRRTGLSFAGPAAGGLDHNLSLAGEEGFEPSTF